MAIEHTFKKKKPLHSIAYRIAVIFPYVDFVVWNMNSMAALLTLDYFKLMDIILRKTNV